jgi:hypothetical protein
MTWQAREDNIKTYARIMKSVKLRTSFLVDPNVQTSDIARMVSIESRCLQARRILEAIVMASLVANKDEYSRVYNDFASKWNAKYLLRELGGVNADFYPCPIKEHSNPDSDIIEQSDFAGDYMTKTRFLKVYKKCNAIAHTENPFGSKTDYNFYERQLPVWMQWIINLLNCHRIRLLGEEGFWLIHMQEDGDDEVHYYRFEPVSR